MFNQRFLIDIDRFYIIYHVRFVILFSRVNMMCTRIYMRRNVLINMFVVYSIISVTCDIYQIIIRHEVVKFVNYTSNEIRKFNVVVITYCFQKSICFLNIYR